MSTADLMSLLVDLRRAVESRDWPALLRGAGSVLSEVAGLLGGPPPARARAAGHDGAELDRAVADLRSAASNEFKRESHEAGTAALPAGFDATTLLTLVELVERLVGVWKSRS